jgi:hypothetical protein
VSYSLSLPSRYFGVGAGQFHHGKTLLPDTSTTSVSATSSFSGGGTPPSWDILVNPATPQVVFYVSVSMFILSYNQQTTPQVVNSFSFPNFDRTLSPCGASSNVCSLFLFNLSTLVFPSPLPSVFAYLFYLSPSGQYILDRWDTPQAQFLRQRPI